MADDLVVPIDWESARNWADYYLEKEGAGIADDLNLARAYLAVVEKRDEWKRRAEDFESRWMNADAVAKEYAGRLAAMTAERDNAREDRNRFVLALNSARAFHDKERLRADALQAQLAAMTAERDSYRDMAKARDDDLAAMRSDLGIARNQCAIMEESLATVARRMDDQKAKLTAMSEERDNWRKAHRETFDRLTRLCADLQQEINDE